MNEERTDALARYSATLLSRGAGEAAPLVEAVVKRLFAVLEEGGVCVPLEEFGEAQSVSARLLSLSVAGKSGEKKPLVLDRGLVYFQRYHALECALAEKLLALAASPAPVPEGADAGEARLLNRRLAVITGGPGTGKTFLAGRLLRLLASAGPLSAILAAPTGRASARLRESADKALDGLPGVVLTHGTVHRVLGSGPDPTKFRHDAAHPLAADVVVLDEASMMDLPLMARFLDAVDPASTRLIVLGDPGQLPSIHSGSVLADIAEASLSPVSPLFSRRLSLSRNRRSGEVPELAALIDAARTGDAEGFLSLLSRGGALSLIAPPSPQHVALYAREILLPYARQIASAATPEEALAAAASERVVCMFRQGPTGADALNEATLALAAEFSHSRGGFFHGLPILVTRNDPARGLFNGDAGVVFRDGPELRAYFAAPGGLRSFSLRDLPPTEAAYALTVHRAQGSEYGRVTLVLPGEGQLLSRELLYTGISRARNALAIAASPATLRAALAAQSRRASGLAARLAQANPAWC